MKLYRPSHLLPILLLASVIECNKQKRALRIISAPPDAKPDEVYKGLNIPKHIDHVAQGGTIGLEFDARRLAGPVGSVWRRVKKLFRGDYKKDWNNMLNKEIPDKRWSWKKPWWKKVTTEEPVGSSTEVPLEEEVTVIDDINAEDRDDDFVLNPRQRNNFRESERVKEWAHV